LPQKFIVVSVRTLFSERAVLQCSVPGSTSNEFSFLVWRKKIFANFHGDHLSGVCVWSNVTRREFRSVDRRQARTTFAWFGGNRCERPLKAVSSRSRLLVSTAVNTHLVVATLLSPSTADPASSYNSGS
jgi:hypothetical protein